MEFLDCRRSGVAAQSLHLRSQGADAVAADLMTQEFHWRLTEGAFGQVEDETRLLEAAKYLSKVEQVLLPVPAGDQNVVDIDEDELEPVEDVIHVALKGHSGIFEAERHPEELK